MQLDNNARSEPRASKARASAVAAPDLASTRAAVFGASGITGCELVQRLGAHPRCDVVAATSRARAGASLRTVDPAAPEVTLVAPDDVDLAGVDIAFVCLPHGEAAPLVERVIARSGCRVIDLSADLRLRAAELHERVYGSPRSAELARQAVYGITELYRDALREARVVSNPGCYPTCSGLALWPLAEAGLLRHGVTINALSGISGAGRATTANTHFCAVADDVRPYKLGRQHRHAAEIDQILADAAPPTDAARPVVFCPHVVPIERGMLATITTRVGELTAREVHELYEQRYAGETFVEVLPFGEPARIRAVARTNRAQIGVHDVAGSDDVVLTCAIDNLVKGASGQAIQTMNLMLGLPEGSGFSASERGRFADAPAPSGSVC